MNWRCALGAHDWRELWRSSLMWDTVNYICLRCGDECERWEGPEQGEFSLDPKIKAEQEADKAERLAEARERFS